MPVPAAFTDLSETPSANSPGGSEPIGTQANEYFQAAFAFIKQLADGIGFKPTGVVNFNAQKATGLAAGSTTSLSTDALTGAQVRALAYKVGELRAWHGAIANIGTVWGAGWQLADGTNGTADLTGRFILGASGGIPVGQTGGVQTQALSVANMPAHNHPVNDPGHAHLATVGDPGHAHTQNAQTFYNAGGVGFTPSGTGTNISLQSNLPTFNNFTGIGVSIGNSTTGITTQSVGFGNGFENRPPYYALCYVEYTGIGA